MQDRAELLGRFLPRDRMVFGPGATREVRLRNVSPRDLDVQGLEVRWTLGAAYLLRWEQPRTLMPGQEAAVLDLLSFARLTRLAQQAGQRSFGFDGTVHEVTLLFGGPAPGQATFRVRWGFAAADHDLGFFLVEGKDR